MVWYNAENVSCLLFECFINPSAILWVFMTYQYKTLTSAGSLAGTYEVLQLAYLVEPMAI